MTTVEFMRSLLIGYLDFFALMFLYFSLFRFDISRNKISAIILPFVLSLFSTTLLSLNVPSYITILLQIILIIAYGCLILKERIIYSLWTILVVYVSYIILQSIVVFIFLQVGFLQTEDLNKSFTLKGDIVIFAYSIVSMVISLYIKLFNGGFAVYFRKKNNENFHLYILLSVATLIVLIVCGSLIYYSLNASYVIITSGLILIMVITLYIFTNRRDEHEYSVMDIAHPKKE